MYTRYS